MLCAYLVVLILYVNNGSPCLSHCGACYNIPKYVTLIISHLYGCLVLFCFRFLRAKRKDKRTKTVEKRRMNKSKCIILEINIWLKSMSLVTEIYHTTHSQTTTIWINIANALRSIYSNKYLKVLQSLVTKISLAF
jgi:uncharacterized integral membrane protein